jgi:hypothetical protein
MLLSLYFVRYYFRKYNIYTYYITMNFVVAIYCALLFYVLSPGVFLRLPQNGSKMMVTAVHAAIFGIILYFTQKAVWKMSLGLEGFQEGKGGSHSSSHAAYSSGGSQQKKKKK